MDRFLQPILLSLLPLAVVGCGSVDCHDTLNCSSPTVTAGDAGPDTSSNATTSGDGDGDADVNTAGNTDGGTSDARDGGTIDPSGAPICKNIRVEGCIPSADDAIFLRPGSSAGGLGVRVDPVGTLAEAEDIAKLNQASRLVICGEMTEPIVLDSSVPFRRIEGGFDCDTWLYSADDETKVSTSAAVPALELHDIDELFIIRDVTFESADADTPGQSSIAAFIQSVTEVTFERVRLVAGNASDGTDGALHEFVAGTEWPAVVDGGNANGDTAGAARNFTCPDGVATRGGAGWAVFYDAANNDDCGNTPAQDGLPAGISGSAGDYGATGAISVACTDGGDATSDGTNGNDGASATTLGALTAAGWSANPGTAGTLGTPGGSGGGGGARPELDGSSACITYYSGGGGGLGGCGGNGGDPGQAGGSSIALLLFDSTLSVSGGALSAADAGNGGGGTLGQLGQLGGTGGQGSSPACDGGNAANGGRGGDAGSGAGGISAAILWSGIAPTFAEGSDAPDLGIGNAGLGGPSPGGNIEDAIDGLAETVVEATSPEFD